MAAQLLIVSSDVTQQTLVDALRRAAYLLRRSGFGQVDNETALIIEEITLKGPQGIQTIGEASERWHKANRSDGTEQVSGRADGDQAVVDGEGHPD